MSNTPTPSKMKNSAKIFWLLLLLVVCQVGPVGAAEKAVVASVVALTRILAAESLSLSRTPAPSWTVPFATAATGRTPVTEARPQPRPHPAWHA